MNLKESKKYATKVLLENDFSEGEAIDMFAKSILEGLFCDGSSQDFDELTVAQLKEIHSKINECVDWINS